MQGVSLDASLISMTGTTKTLTEYQVEEIIHQSKRSVSLNNARVWVSEIGGKEYKTIEVSHKHDGDTFHVCIWGGRKHEAAIYPNSEEARNNGEAKKYQTSLNKVCKAVCKVVETDYLMINWGIWDEDGNETGKTFEDVQTEMAAR